MFPTVSYYRIPSGQNAGFAVVFGDWPERVLQHRGWTCARYVCQRQATAEEQAWLARCNRYQAIRYRTVEGLLEDEARIVDPQQFERLARLLRQPSQAALQSGVDSIFGMPNRAAMQQSTPTP